MLARQVLFVLPVTVFAAVAVYFYIGLGRDSRTIPSALIDKAAPAFDLPPVSADRKGFKSADLKGQVSLVNVFASWCGPCRLEHPLLMRLAEDEAVTIYGINYKDKPADAIAWLDQLGDPYARIGGDLSGRVGIDWGVYGVPETYIVDKEGRIRFKQVGPVNAELLEKTILPMIEDLRR